MTIKEFIRYQFGNADGKTKWCSSVYKDGNGNMYSYGYHYPLLFKVEGYTFLNVAGYSVTTAKHINWAGQAVHYNTINIKLPRDFHLTRDTTLQDMRKILIDELTELTFQMARKARKNTRVYKDLELQQERLERDVKTLTEAINAEAIA